MNMKTENCTYNDFVVKQILRKKGCHVPALSYDSIPGTGSSFSGLFGGLNEIPFRKDDKMRFVKKVQPAGSRGDDNPWQKYDLLLAAGEWAAYTVNIADNEKITVSALLTPAAYGSELEIFINGAAAQTIRLESGSGLYRQALCELTPETVTADKTLTVRIKAPATINKPAEITAITLGPKRSTK